MTRDEVLDIEARFANLECAVCRGPVRRVEFIRARFDDLVFITAFCHGETETVELSGMEVMALFFSPKVKVSTRPAFERPRLGA